MPTPTTPPTPTCSKCGYHLTGLGVDDVCPECGTAIWQQEGVQSISGFAITALAMGWLVLSLLVIENIISFDSLFGIGTMIALGMTGVISGYLATVQVRRGTRGGATKGIAIAGMILSGTLLSLGLLTMFVGMVIGFRI